jgi:Flp pilus assembly protein TadB
MRTLCLLVNFAVLGVALYFGSLLGLAIALGICVVLVTLFFIFSMASNEARESKRIQREMGRNTTFLAGLFHSSKR